MGFVATKKASPAQIAVPILISVLGITFAAAVARLLQNGTLAMLMVSKNTEINFTFTMQTIVLAVASAAMGVIYFYDRTSFRTFLRITPSVAETPETEWNMMGPILALAFTLGTTMYMSFSVTAQHGAFNESFLKLLPLVLLFAATNAWSEEVISRFVIVAGLHDKLRSSTICWISAVIFGVPHFFGTPNGVPGVVMSGLMGWLLAKSVLETRSLGWAVFIHFLQDVVIFGGGAMILAAHDQPGT